MDLAEQLAKFSIEAILPGAMMRFRAGQSRGEHDFDLDLPDGQTVALEVTTAADEAYLQALDAVSSEKRGGPFVRRRASQQGWYVCPAEGERIDRIRSQVDDRLARVEEAGLTEFGFDHRLDNHPMVMQLKAELGVVAGRVMQWDEPGLIRIGNPGRGAWFDGSSINTAVEREAHKEDNRNKLRRAGTPETHLFVYIHSSSFAASVAMERSMLPNFPAAIPEEITQVWTAAYVRSKAALRVLRASRNGSWHDLGILLLDGYGDIAGSDSVSG